MFYRTATIDSSCLIALHHLDLLKKLSLLFDRVYVPQRVRIEVNKEPNLRRQLRKLLKEVALYQPCDVAQPDRINILLLERRSKRGQKTQPDRGEAEAIIQATELGATIVLVDDRKGREWARGHRVEPHGMIWVLRQFHETGVIPKLGPVIRKLIKRGYRLPENEVKQLLEQFGEVSDS